MSASKIYNIAAGQSFVDVLAERFLQEYSATPEALANVLFLLPNRRACQNLADAFVRCRGLTPTILPQILPIADVEEDEVFLTGRRDIIGDLAPEISRTERVLIFTRLIMQKPRELGLGYLTLAQAYALAENLADLIDLTYNQNLDFSRLKEIVPAEYAIHWQESLKLLSIITEFWPQILQERGVVDASFRRNQLLQSEIKIWQQNKTEQRIVIAGTTAAFPLVKELVKTVLSLPNGEVYLYGLDYYLDDNSWAQIDENHPQFELKELLEYLQISRTDVTSINHKLFTERERLVAEIMRPASGTAEWRRLQISPITQSAFNGLKLITCDDIRQEAKAISMIIRHTLETPEKTAALVTMDRNLARRVVAELKKWNIIADDSSGQPLSLTPIGVYLRLIMNVLESDFSQVSLLSLLKYPFTACGYKYADFNMKVRYIELAWRKKDELTSEQEELLAKVKDVLLPLANMYANATVNLHDFFVCHIQTAERLADTLDKTGDKIIWRGDAGSACAKFVSEMVEKSPLLENIKSRDYSAFFESMLSEQNVRVRFGMHPRVKILGPIEARLSQFDVTIIGEANEGVWPKLPNADLWMSRPMKRDFGFPLPERSIGVMASDFAHLLNGKEVFITRAERADGTPTNKSRWWLRFETVVTAILGDKKENQAFLYDTPYAQWAKYLERALPQDIVRIAPPEPSPRLQQRPNKLSAVNFEMLMRDPYTVFAKYVLGLYPLDELDEDLAYRDYGNIVHKVIEDFNQKYNHQYPTDAKDELLRLGEEQFALNKVAPDMKAFWWPRFVKTIEWLVATEYDYRPDIATVHNEIKGEIKFSLPHTEFTLTAKADRIDETKDGRINILDYKTGKARSVPEVVTGMAPQLSIEGLIAENGGFAGIPPKEVATMRYWKLGDKEVITSEEQSRKGLQNTLDNIELTLRKYYTELAPYRPKPNPSSAPEYSDYDHLSRYLEWAVKQDKKEDGDE